MLQSVFDTSSPAAPSGTIGSAGSQSGLAAFNALGAGAAIVGGVTWLWSAVGIPDADTSGYVPVITISDATAANPSITSDGPCVVVLTLVATGAGGSQSFERTHDVGVTSPVAALAAVSNQDTTNQITFDSSASTGTGLVRSWSLRSQPPSSAASLSSTGDVVSPTLNPDLAGTWRVRVTVTDTWGRTSYTERGFRVGDAYGWITVDGTAGTLYDTNSVQSAPPVSAGSGYYTQNISTAVARHSVDDAARRVYALPLTFAQVSLIELELTATASTVDNLTSAAGIYDSAATPANGAGIALKSIQSTGVLARGGVTGAAAPSYVNITCTKLEEVGTFHVLSGDRVYYSYVARADTGAGLAYNIAVTWGGDTSGIPAVGTVNLIWWHGATAAATGSIPTRLRYRVTAR